MSTKSARQFQSSGRSSTTFDGEHGLGKQSQTSPLKYRTKMSYNLRKRDREHDTTEYIAGSKRSRTIGPTLQSSPIASTSKAAASRGECTTAKNISPPRVRSLIHMDDSDEDDPLPPSAKTRAPRKQVEVCVAKRTKRPVAARPLKVQPTPTKITAPLATLPPVLEPESEPEPSEASSGDPPRLGGGSSDSYSISTNPVLDDEMTDLPGSEDQVQSSFPDASRLLPTLLQSPSQNARVQLRDRLSAAMRAADTSRVLLSLLSSELIKLEKERQRVNVRGYAYDCYLSHSTLQGVLRWKFGALSAQRGEAEKHLNQAQRQILRLEEMLVDELLCTRWSDPLISSLIGFKDWILRPFI